MTKTLINPTDAELEIAFAEAHGWTACGESKSPSFWFPPDWPRTRRSLHETCKLPDFTASLDAVWPYLNEKEVWQILSNNDPYDDQGRGFSVVVGDTFTECLKEPEGRGEAHGPSAPRAIVIALLRAKGWVVFNVK